MYVKQYVQLSEEITKKWTAMLEADKATNGSTLSHLDLIRDFEKFNHACGQ
jgi:hypothetical protein